MRGVPVILSTLAVLRRQPLNKLKLYSWDISQQHSYLTPAWKSTPQELCAGTGTTWQHVATYQGKMFLSIHASVWLATFAIPEASGKPYDSW